jgi:hypothetical protein
MQILRRLWSEDHLTFSGRDFQLETLRPVSKFVGGRKSNGALAEATRTPHLLSAPRPYGINEPALTWRVWPVM